MEYVFHCLINQFLGFKYDLIISDEVNDYNISCNSKSLDISNVFFREEKVAKLYILENIPSTVSVKELEFSDDKFPQVTLFGNPNLRENNNGYSWENDVVAATYYMLTRWEEAVISNRDEHNRFMAKDSLAYKCNFLHRPIVNEYVEILHQVLKSFGLKQSRICRKYKTIATHDVDRPYLWGSTFQKVKSLGASMIIRRELIEIESRLRSVIKRQDPYDTFDHIMDKAESIDEKAYFFFMAGGDTQYDDYYSLEEDRVAKLINKIKSRNHFIGIHPSYNTYNNKTELAKEIVKLEKVTKTNIVGSRQHFLRFDPLVTWDILDKSNIAWDSTMSYADKAGFRSGICYEYPVYDIKNRRQLSLKERPLIVMDTTLQKYEKLNSAEALIRVKDLQDEVKKYRGDFVFLWHNSSFNSQEWLGYNRVFEQMYCQN